MKGILFPVAMTTNMKENFLTDNGDPDWVSHTDVPKLSQKSVQAVILLFLFAKLLGHTLTC